MWIAVFNHFYFHKDIGPGWPAAVLKGSATNETYEKTDRAAAGKKWALIGLALFLVATVLICWQVGLPMVRLASDPENFRQWLEERKLGGLLIYGAMVFFQVLFAVIPGEPLEIAGGYAFGAVWGNPRLSGGGYAGKSLGLWIGAAVRDPSGGGVFSRRKAPCRPIFTELSQATSLPRDLLIPGTPKDLLCYFAGLTDIKFPVFLLVCSLGRLPSVVTSTVGGDALGTQDYLFAVVVFVVTFLISVGGLLCYRQICKRHNTRKEGAERPKKGGGKSLAINRFSML